MSAPEVSEEQRARDGLCPVCDWPMPDDGFCARHDHFARGYTREHERAEGLAKALTETRKILDESSERYGEIAKILFDERDASRASRKEMLDSFQKRLSAAAGGNDKAYAQLRDGYQRLFDECNKLLDDARADRDAANMRAEDMAKELDMDEHQARLTARQAKWESIPERIREASRNDSLISAYMGLVMATDGAMWDAEAATQLIVKMAERETERTKQLMDIYSNGLSPMVIQLQPERRGQ